MVVVDAGVHHRDLHAAPVRPSCVLRDVGAGLLDRSGELDAGIRRAFRQRELDHRVDRLHARQSREPRDVSLLDRDGDAVPQRAERVALGESHAGFVGGATECLLLRCEGGTACRRRRSALPLSSTSHERRRFVDAAASGSIADIAGPCQRDRWRQR